MKQTYSSQKNLSAALLLSSLSKPELKDKKDELVEKALLLLEEESQELES